MGLATLQDASIDSIPRAVSTVLGQQTCHRCILACVITAQQDDSRVGFWFLSCARCCSMRLWEWKRRSLTANFVLLWLARDYWNPFLGCGLEYLDVSTPFLAAPRLNKDHPQPPNSHHGRFRYQAPPVFSLELGCPPPSKSSGSDPKSPKGWYGVARLHASIISTTRLSRARLVFERATTNDVYWYTTRVASYTSSRQQLHKQVTLSGIHNQTFTGLCSAGRKKKSKKKVLQSAKLTESNDASQQLQGLVLYHCFLLLDGF